MKRLDFQTIGDWVADGSRVLDLGCEDGALIAYLQQRRHVRGIGVDMNNAQLTRCLARDIQVVHTDIRRDLSLFATASFDYVVLSQTLQSIDQPPQKLLNEMLRVGKTAVVSFPNFAYWRLRAQLAAGRMPSGGQLPYSWHDTPNVRYCTIRDFEEWCGRQRLRVRERVYLNPGGAVRFLPNLLAETGIYQLTVNSGSLC